MIFWDRQEPLSNLTNLFSTSKTRPFFHQVTFFMYRFMRLYLNDLKKCYVAKVRKWGGWERYLPNRKTKCCGMFYFQVTLTDHFYTYPNSRKIKMLTRQDFSSFVSSFSVFAIVKVHKDVPRRLWPKKT